MTSLTNFRDSEYPLKKDFKKAAAPTVAFFIIVLQSSTILTLNESQTYSQSSVVFNNV